MSAEEEEEGARARLEEEGARARLMARAAAQAEVPRQRVPCR